MLSKEDDGIVARFAATDDDEVRDAIAEIDKRLTALVREQLRPRAVEYILPITPQEGTRWTKDGSYRNQAGGKRTFSIQRISLTQCCRHGRNRNCMKLRVGRINLRVCT